MRIGIITFHFAWNCGAVLQCYALKTTLKKMGHETVIINYQPNYNEEKYKKYPNAVLLASSRLEGNKYSKFLLLPFATYYFLKNIKSVFFGNNRIDKANYFESFLDTNFDLTKIYKSLDDLKNDPPKLDVLISGSDQVWNPKLTNNTLDGAYFCDFGSKSIKRVGYAISACQLDTFAEKEKISTLINNFNYLSLRETEKKLDLDKLYRGDIQICVDPTFLLESNEYLALEEKCNNIKDSYILVYAFDFKELRPLLYKTVKSISELRHKRIKVIYGPLNWPYDVDMHQPKNCISPGMFLTYIKNADVIITNSFHATTFSLIYEKNFFSLIAPNRGSRVKELLSNLGLQDRIITDEMDIPNVHKNIPYNDVNEVISNLRKKSIEFLWNSINDGKDDA